MAEFYDDKHADRAQQETIQKQIDDLDNTKKHDDYLMDKALEDLSKLGNK